MKNLILSIGFAAATVFAAQAQETQQYPESQTEDMNTQTQEQNAQEEGQQLEGMNNITESELPEAVTNYIQDEYKDAKVGEIYEISGEALSRIVSNRSSGAVTSAFNNPEKLFQVQITTDEDKGKMLYLTEDGDLYDETSL